jgi:hypothetical protein
MNPRNHAQKQNTSDTRPQVTFIGNRCETIIA